MNDQTWRPSDSYVRPQDRAREAPECARLPCRAAALFFLVSPPVLLLAALALLLQGCAPRPAKRCYQYAPGKSICSCKDPVSGRYVECR